MKTVTWGITWTKEAYREVDIEVPDDFEDWPQEKQLEYFQEHVCEDLEYDYFGDSFISDCD